MFSIPSGVDYCDHGEILLEIGFGLGLVILIGKFLDLFFPLMTFVQEIIQGTTCAGFEFLGWVSGWWFYVLIVFLFHRSVWVKL
jgi:hypothetical protein